MSDLTAALVAARKKMTDPKLAGTNPHFGSKFVPLDEALAVIVPALLDQDVLLWQGIDSGELVTTVRKGAEEAILCRYPIPAISDPQKYLAAVTYARRGSLMASFALAGDPDDDGNAAAKAAKDAEDEQRREVEAEFQNLVKTIAEHPKRKAQIKEELGLPARTTLEAFQAAFVAADEATRQEVWAAANGLEKP